MQQPGERLDVGAAAVDVLDHDDEVRPGVAAGTVGERPGQQARHGHRGDQQDGHDRRPPPRPHREGEQGEDDHEDRRRRPDQHERDEGQRPVEAEPVGDERERHDRDDEHAEQHPPGTRPPADADRSGGGLRVGLRPPPAHVTSGSP